MEGIEVAAQGDPWDFGNSLREMQNGRAAKLQVRPMQSIGAGLFELKDTNETTWYRMVYLARIEDTIYVLDCFENDTAKTERKASAPPRAVCPRYGEGFWRNET
jgi:phage-related protein